MEAIEMCPECGGPPTQRKKPSELIVQGTLKKIPLYIVKCDSCGLEVQARTIMKARSLWNNENKLIHSNCNCYDT